MIVEEAPLCEKGSLFFCWVWIGRTGLALQSPDQITISPQALSMIVVVLHCQVDPNHAVNEQQAKQPTCDVESAWAGQFYFR